MQIKTRLRGRKVGRFVQREDVPESGRDSERRWEEEPGAEKSVESWWEDIKRGDAVTCQGRVGGGRGEMVDSRRVGLHKAL